MRAVLPLVRVYLPWVRLRVTGANPPPEIVTLRGPNVLFEGHVEALSDFYDAVRVVIVPMRYGSGVKIKTIESLQYGVPVVTTSLGAEGVDTRARTALDIADDPRQFADRVVSLLTDEHVWSSRRASIVDLARQLGPWSGRNLVRADRLRVDGGTMPPTRYSYDIDLDNLNTSHAVGILSVPPGNRVLDVGAADGSVARLLTGRGCRVWGIEVDETAARAAATICQRVFIRDVEHTELDAELEATPFDTILFLDILEHLRDPLALLKRAQRWLEPHGQIIASIPNVTHGAVRLNLLKGNFTYTDTGLLDRTHLHFFDRMAVEALFDAAGLQVRDRLRITRAITETEIPSRPRIVPGDRGRGGDGRPGRDHVSVCRRRVTQER